VSFNKRTNLYFASAIAIVAALTCMLAVCLASQSQTEKPNSERPDGNGKCYVCHPGLKTEEITTIHVKMNVTCDECHGPSVEHMHDEMLMTKPDLLFGRSEVNRMCSNPICHTPGGPPPADQVYGRQDHKDHAAVEAFYKKWLGRTRPNGRAITPDSVCTDCHGKHNLDKPIDTQSEQAEWVAAFNGRDLTGWSTFGDSGGASWSVKAGRIVASAGPNGEAGDLWTEAMYEDYLLAVTFRADWPIRAGIWLRAAGYEGGPRIEIIETLAAKKRPASTGSVRVPGKGYALANLREDLIDRESWNTLSVKVQGNRIQVWLNGEEVGAVRLPGPAKGRIGLHIEGRSVSKPSELHVREVLVQQLSKSEETTSESTSSGSSDKPKQASATAIRARAVPQASYRRGWRSL